MLTAATAWDGLAAVLNSAASSYAAVLTGLAAESWLGPASASMAAAIAPFAGWMGTAATLAEQTANQARRASSAFEAAFAMTVPPALIEANRSQLASLLETNLFGLNTPAIEAIQADYAEMWAQDAAAMFTYAAASESASALTPFTQPLQVTHPTGTVTEVAASNASAEALTGLGFSITPQMLQGLTTLLSSASAGLLDIPAGLDSLLGELDLAATYIAVTATASLALAVVNTARPWIFSYAGTSVDEGLDSGTPQPAHSAPVRSGADGAGMPRGIAASAGVGQGALVGGLKVPHSWTTAAPEIRLAVEALPSAAVGPTPTNFGAAPAALLSGMALAGMAGRGGAPASGRETADAGTDDETQPQRKPTVVVIQQPPSAPGPPSQHPR
ncbi:hypothetical protein A5635_12850 [Mycobacterium asiaticum]|uniref:PPE family domain-containing protein n=2 Tax=Mycobacterium asiaticum TaxID=1790 RepID=A0A1A3UM61_MYCAS|nr:hypothetical protein A5635_12850 [Mycobacterium asiaticum]OBK95921.1 hypothetical protein A5645_10950 [Mycobacterium asiaticum]